MCDNHDLAVVDDDDDDDDEDDDDEDLAESCRCRQAQCKGNRSYEDSGNCKALG